MIKQFLKSTFDIVREPPPEHFPSPIFITGCMRSGTTLLLNSLCEHPQILKIGNEINNIWTTLCDAPCGIDGFGPNEYRNETHLKTEHITNMTYYFAQYIERSKKFKGIAMRISYRYNNGSGGIFKDFNNIIPITKSPHLVNKTRFLRHLFPSCKIIFIVRSIYSHCYSQKAHFINTYKSYGERVAHLPVDPKDYWTRIYEKEVTDTMRLRVFPDDFSLIPEAWINMNYLGLKELNEYSEGNFHLVSFEQMLESPVEVFQNLFEFLDLDPKHKRHGMKIAKASRKPLNSHTQGSPLDLWKKKLTQSELDTIQKQIETNKDKYEYIRTSLEKFNLTLS